MKNSLLLTLLLCSQLTHAKDIPAGPMLGFVGLKGANVWLISPEPGEATIRYWPKGDKQSQRQGMRAKWCRV